MNNGNGLPNVVLFLLLFVFRRGDYGSGYSLLCRPIAAQPTHTQLIGNHFFFVNVFGVFFAVI